jgi:hypothetical protein
MLKLLLCRAVQFFQVFVELSHRDRLTILRRTACSRAQVSAIEIDQDQADTAEDQDSPGSARLAARPAENELISKRELSNLLISKA